LPTRVHVVIHQGSAGAAKYSFTAGLPQPTIRKPWADVRSNSAPGQPRFAPLLYLQKSALVPAPLICCRNKDWLRL